jgi:Terminase large subunit, ATPase domain
VNILEAFRHPHVFGSLPAFQDLGTWSAWGAFLAAIYGLPMTEAQLATFRAHTGCQTPRPEGYSEAVAIVGRQSGKTRVAAMIAVFEAITATEETGAELSALLVAQDHRAALRTLFKYASVPFDLVPTLASTVIARTSDTITLQNGVAISAYPCRPQAVRGLRSRITVCDELAFFKSSEGFPTDVEMLRALRPTLATTRGKLIVLSSPYAQTGALYDLHRRHYGREDSSVLVWTASASEMILACPPTTSNGWPRTILRPIAPKCSASFDEVSRRSSTPKRLRRASSPITANCCRARGCGISRTSIRAAAGRTPSPWRSRIAITTA